MLFMNVRINVNLTSVVVAVAIRCLLDVSITSRLRKLLLEHGRSTLRLLIETKSKTDLNSKKSYLS
jgi:hypothetical protein